MRELDIPRTHAKVFPPLRGWPSGYDAEVALSDRSILRGLTQFEWRSVIAARKPLTQKEIEEEQGVERC